MTKKSFLFIALIALVPLNAALAIAFSKPSTIKNITVDSGYARIELTDNTGDFESCSSERQWYYLEFTSSKEMYAALLAAKMSGQKVYLASNGCVGSYSKISHVYICETANCI
jgi:hypothetical protein